MREAALPAGKQGGQQPQLCSSLGLGCAWLGRRRCWGVPGREQSRRGDRDSHVAQLRLPAHQDLPDPLDPEELSLDVIDGGGGVGHGHDLILWKRNGSHLGSRRPAGTSGQPWAQQHFPCCQPLCRDKVPHSQGSPPLPTAGGRGSWKLLEGRVECPFLFPEPRPAQRAEPAQQPPPAWPGANPGHTKLRGEGSRG